MTLRVADLVCRGSVYTLSLIHISGPTRLLLGPKRRVRVVGLVRLRLVRARLGALVRPALRLVRRRLRRLVRGHCWCAGAPSCSTPATVLGLQLRIGRRPTRGRPVRVTSRTRRRLAYFWDLGRLSRVSTPSVVSRSAHTLRKIGMPVLLCRLGAWSAAPRHIQDLHARGTCGGPSAGCCAADSTFQHHGQRRVQAGPPARQSATQQARSTKHAGDTAAAAWRAGRCAACAGAAAPPATSATRGATGRARCPRRGYRQLHEGYECVFRVNAASLTARNHAGCDGP